MASEDNALPLGYIAFVITKRSSYVIGDWKIEAETKGPLSANNILKLIAKYENQYFYSIPFEICSQVSNSQQANIASNNGLVLNRRQAQGGLIYRHIYTRTR